MVGRSGEVAGRAGGGGVINRLPHLAQRLLNVPIAIKPEKAEIVVAAVGDRFGITNFMRANGDTIAMSPMAMEDADEAALSSTPRRQTDMGYDLVGGVAVIQVEGTLVQKNYCMRPYSGMTGYDGIRQAFFNALRDGEVKAIALEIDSPGGEVAGCFDLVDLIYSKRGEKPVWAILSECAYSAAYAIASAAEFVTVPRTGGAGSVGCIMLHANFSRALKDAGVKVTLIKHGDRKADGNEYEPLSKEAFARAQADIDAMGELFIETIARNRGLKPAAVRATQAATYLGAQCLDAGFADAVMAPEEEAFPALLAELG
jgi:capsid assembly protease